MHFLKTAQRKKAEVESSSAFMEKLNGTIEELSNIVAQLSATIAQLQETFVRINTRIKNLKNNQCGGNRWDDGGNIWNQRDQPANNVDWDLGIKLVIPEYDGKLKPNEFIDWIVCMENIFACKPMAEGHKVTLIATWFCNYVAIWWAELQEKGTKT